LSFKDAGEELGLTPTAISHHIRLLEDHCGVKLFRRHPRPLGLTPAGEKLLPGLRQGFDMFAAALASIGRADDDAPLRITSTNAFASRWLAPRLGGWRAKRPDVSLSVIGTDRIVGPGEADLAIRYARLRLLTPGASCSAIAITPFAAPVFLWGPSRSRRPPISGATRSSITTGSSTTACLPIGSAGSRPPA
jgi:DNA-binding transcriptional LysR family regulator